jgi:competence protein ComEA
VPELLHGLCKKIGSGFDSFYPAAILGLCGHGSSALNYLHGAYIMQKSFISAALFSLIAGFSLAATANQTNPPSTAPAAVQAAAVAPVTMVNLNSADASTLEQVLVGVGEVKAQAIVEYRNANGPFTSVDQLLEVKGIGAATLEKNRSKMSIN